MFVQDIEQEIQGMMLDAQTGIHRVYSSDGEGLAEYLRGKLHGLTIINKLMKELTPRVTSLQVVNSKIVKLSEITSANQARIRYVLNNLKNTIARIVQSATRQTPQRTFCLGQVAAFDSVLSRLTASYLIE